MTEERPPCGGAPTHAVRAAPAHIVVAALSGWFDPCPVLVLSGVNRGANVGRAILHSGTVGAALTAGLHDRRGLAVSLDVALGSTRAEHRDAVDEHLPSVLGLVAEASAGTVLSLNVPDLPADRHRELRSASLDRHEIDGLYELTLAAGLEVGTVLLSGPQPETVVPAALYRRLAADLTANDVHVFHEFGVGHLEQVDAGVRSTALPGSVRAPGVSTGGSWGSPGCTQPEKGCRDATGMERQA